MSKSDTIHDNIPAADEEQQFFNHINDAAAAYSAKREKERRESRAARDQKRAENKAKQDRAHRIHWWFGLVHWHIHYVGCACAIFLFLLFGLPDNLALIAAVLVLAEFFCVTRWIYRSRPRKEK